MQIIDVNLLATFLFKLANTLYNCISRSEFIIIPVYIPPAAPVISFWEKTDEEIPPP